ncbi:MAG: glycosyltransferase family 4 protein [Sulfurovum sp.]|nr:glycosyltransferase family 4 protein [Sulfurovum sp.]
MRVVQLLPELNEGGVERGTVELSRELVKRGHESIVISAGGRLVLQIEQDGGKHITLDVCSKNPLTALWRVWKLRKVLKRYAPEILHARSRVPAWLTYLANRTLKIPFVTTVHGFNSVSPYSAVMTKADRVICVSGAIRQYIQAHYGVSREKSVVIPRGIDLEKFSSKNVDEAFIQHFRQAHALEGKFVVSTIGRITQLKDHQTFIRAIALIKQQNPNVVGLIVGGVRSDKSHYLQELKQLVETLELSEQIRFTGSQQQVAEIYALSDVVVSSSKKPESFGRSVAEAIAMNTPVVATAHGGVLDIIKEGENGYFYPVGDANALAESIVKANMLTFDGFDYIKTHFSLEQMVDKTVNLYKELT